MDLPDLNQTFFNLLSQFQAEQIYTAGIDEVTRSHADDLDGFKNTYVEMKKENISHEENIRAL